MTWNWSPNRIAFHNAHLFDCHWVCYQSGGRLCTWMVPGTYTGD